MIDLENSMDTYIQCPKCKYEWNQQLSKDKRCLKCGEWLTVNYKRKHQIRLILEAIICVLTFMVHPLLCLMAFGFIIFGHLATDTYL